MPKLLLTVTLSKPLTMTTTLTGLFKLLYWKGYTHICIRIHIYIRIHIHIHIYTHIRMRTLLKQVKIRITHKNRKVERKLSVKTFDRQAAKTILSLIVHLILKLRHYFSQLALEENNTGSASLSVFLCLCVAYIILLFFPSCNQPLFCYHCCCITSA